MCGLCVETRRSSTHMLPGDYLTSPPPALNRFSKTLRYTQNRLTQGEITLYLNWPRIWPGSSCRGRGRHVEISKWGMGSLHYTNTVELC